MNKYFNQYKWANIFTMLRNQKKEPNICEQNFIDRLVVITGATSGIGYETAIKYASMGSNILSINRNEEKSENLCQLIRDEYGVSCEYFLADFSVLDDIHEAGEYLKNYNQPIDVMIHNAGAFNTKRVETKDGYEAVFQINYLSTFVLNHYIIDKLKRQNYGRIIYVSSEAHRFKAWGIHMDDLSFNKHRYTGMRSYSSAKVAQLLSMLMFDQQLSDSKVTINAMHPGNVKTNSGTSNGKFYKFYKKQIIDRLAKPIWIASESLYYLGVSNEVSNISGKFFNLTTQELPAPPALDYEEAEKLYNISLKLGGIS